MAVRKNLTHPQVVRERIRASAIVRRLQKFVLGERGDQGEVIEMTPPQVAAALGLIKKVLPDLSAMEWSGEVKHKHVTELPDAELEHIARGGGDRAAAPAARAADKPGVH